MAGQTALLTFSIGPVHTFIEQARRLADQWAGSQILSHLIATAIGTLKNSGGAMVFPFVESNQQIPDGLPNRFVCRVSLDIAEEVAEAMRAAVLDNWIELTNRAVAVLPSALKPAPSIWNPEDKQQKKDYAARTIEVSWSWVAENGDYAAVARSGAERFAASRMYRPFAQVDERDDKCAVCGERTALPDGGRKTVRDGWKEAPERISGPRLRPYFRADQGRLCLVCVTKRLFPYVMHQNDVHFPPFDAFEPKEEAASGSLGGESKPYVAVVKMDGDQMGQVLGWGAGTVRGSVEKFHMVVSKVLTDFTKDLRSPSAGVLNLNALESYLNGYKLVGHNPALVYAGGEDVLFVSDPRDALPLALAIRSKYRGDFKPSVSEFLCEEDLNRLTISAAICIVHTRHPAGLTFRDVEELLKHVAKDREGRDAVAIRLAKRGGSPVEVGFKWEESSGGGLTWIERFNALVASLQQREIASTKSFNLAEEERILAEVLKDDEWPRWLAERLSHGTGSSDQAARLADLVAPFFVRKKTEALRIARFLGREVGQ